MIIQIRTHLNPFGFVEASKKRGKQKDLAKATHGTPDTSTFVTSCPIGMSLPADSSCEGMVSLHFTQSGLSMPSAAGVVDEKGSEYILAHTGPRELDGHPLGGCGSGFGLVRENLSCIRGA